MAQRKSARTKDKKRSEQSETERELDAEYERKVASLRPSPKKAAPKKSAPRAEEPIPEGRGTMLLMGMLTIFLTGARLAAGKTVGFGDSEALYASYALFPQAAYLDHPGLIGLLARTIGNGIPPTPMDAHQITTTVSMFTPWLGFGAARAFGATRRGAALTGIALTVVPQMAIGLFALAPDTILAPLWLASIALALGALASPRGAFKRNFGFVASGLLAGVATSAKVSGICLLASLAIAHVAINRKKPRKERDPFPLIGIMIGLIPVFPIVQWEVTHGYPMLRHRFVETQAGGPSLAAIGTTFGGQLLYVSPIFLFLAIVLGRKLYLARKSDDATSLLFWNMAVSIGVLVPVSLLARTAEPHWLAPIFLPIAIFASRQDPIRFGRAGAISAAALSAFVYAWVLVPGITKLWPKSIDRKGDITTELFGWPQTIGAVIETVESQRTPGSKEDVVVVGPHWTVCGQLRAALPRDIDVGCMTPTRDDFDGWLPRETWQKRGTIVLVTTDKIPVEKPEELLPAFAVDADSHVSLYRDGKPLRVFHVFVLKKIAKT